MKILTITLSVFLFAVSCFSQVIEVQETGWYSVSFSQLQAAGLDIQSNQNNWRLYHNSQEVPIKITSNSIEFFGEKKIGTHSNLNGYLLRVHTGGTPKRVISENVTVKGNPSNEYIHTVSYNYDLFYSPYAVNGSEKDNWIGHINYPDGNSFDINVPQCFGSNGQISFEVSKYLGPPTSFIEIKFNGISLGQFNQSFTANVSNLQSGANTISLFGYTESGGLYSIDNVKVQCTRTTIGGTDNAVFTLSGTNKREYPSPSRVFKFASSGDIIEHTSPVISQSGGQTTNTYLLSYNALSPVTVRQSNIYPSGNASLIIVTCDEFLSTAVQLQNIKSGTYTSKIVTVNQIYDSFGNGVKSPDAIKSALNYEKNNGAQYVIFLGDSSYDPKNIEVGGDFVPTYFYETSVGEGASDSRLSDFDGDGVEDLYSGRLPINNLSEGQIFLDKIVRFNNQVPRDPEVSFFVADSLFDITADGYIAMLPQNTPYTIARKSAMTDAQMKQAIFDNFVTYNPYFVHYVGHGSVVSWNNFFFAWDAVNLQNTELSFVYAGACITGFTSNPQTKSMAESMALAPNGAIVYVGQSQNIWANSVIPSGQSMTMQMYNPSNLTIGQAVREMKLNTVQDEFIGIYIMIGDPTLELK